MENSQEGPVRVRLVFSDRHLLSKEQRSKGLRRCCVVLRPEITTVGEFSHHISNLFDLRCGSADDLSLHMSGFVLPSFESTSVFRDKELIRVETNNSNKKKKKKIAISNDPPTNENATVQKQTILSIDNGENENQHSKRRPLLEEKISKKKHTDLKKSENSKKKLKPTPHESSVIVESPVIVNTNNNNNPSSVPMGSQQNDDPCNPTSEKNKQSMVTSQTEKNVGNGVLGPPPSNLFPGPNNWEAEPSNYKKPFKQSGANDKRNNWKPWTHNWTNNSQLNSESIKGKNIVQEEDEEEEEEEEEEESNKNELDFEGLFPLNRLPREGDIIAYRLVDKSSACLELSPFRVGEVLIFDPIIMDIVLGPVAKYPLFPNGENSRPKNSLYKEDGTLGIEFVSLVDIRLVEEGQEEIAPKVNCSKSVKGKNKGKDNNRKNNHENVDNSSDPSGGNNNSNLAWEMGEASNEREAQHTDENGWGTWAPSNNGSFGSNGRGAGGSNANETIQARVNAWDTWVPSTSRAGWGQNGNFGSRGRGRFPRGRNGRGGGRYFNPKFCK